MLACSDAQMAEPSAVRDVGLKPPENQPQLTFLAFMRLPTLLPDISTLAPVAGAQSSNFAASPPVEITVPLATAAVGCEVVAPWVCPETVSYTHLRAHETGRH